MFPEAEKQTAPRSMHFAIFAIGLLWLLAARAGSASAAQGIARFLRSDAVRPLLGEIFFLILLLTGYTALNWVGNREIGVRASNALPVRATTWREWQKGTAFGWGLLIVAVLPMALVGDLHPQFSWSAQVWGATLVSLLAVLVGSLATEVAFRGFLFRRLIQAVGAVPATVLLSLGYAFVVTSPLNNTSVTFLVAFCAGLLSSLAYLRTYALWLGWGMRFGWLASMSILFGLPLAGSTELSSVISADSSGRLWLTGGVYGPEGAIFSALVLLAGTIALYPLTRDYAWNYTHPPIVPGGYAMHVPPPAAHTAMEQAHAQASTPQLVQILGASTALTPGPGSSTPAVATTPPTLTHAALFEPSEGKHPDAGLHQEIGKVDG